MVSSNRMRQVMTHIEYNNKYFSAIRQTMKEVLTASQEISHPFLNERERGHHTFMVIAGDKGMCGAYNANVLNYTLKRLNETPGSSLITVGDKAEEFFRLRGIHPDITFLGLAQDPTLKRAREVAAHLTYIYEQELTDDIRIINTSFYSEAKGVPVELRLLPITLHSYDDILDAEDITEIMFHPSPQTVFDMMVPQYAIALIFGVMVKSYASENHARMTAMFTATSNAQEILDDLNIRHNLARQTAITNEIAEITGAAESIRPG